MNIIALGLAALSGVAMAVQGTLNTALGKVIGLLEATLVVQIVGTLFAGALILAGLGKGKLSQMGQAPWYTYLGGLIGVVIVYLVITAIDRIGVAAATTAIIVGQISMAAIVDHFGLFGLESIPFSPFKVVGIGLLAFGAWVLLQR